MKPISRRNFNKIVVASGLSFFVPMMNQAMAASQSNKRFLLVILRGGMDGLAAVPPYKDPNYSRARNGLGLPDNAVIPISDIFGLHAALEPLHKMYEQNELSIIHAIASPYRKRSHFEAQDVLENGTDSPEET
ncbi:MAG: hypothetical protein MK137_04740, partial [Rickettsiales bacterium]|nr:hypothetical protein [Rickettsiales bacterium]